MTQPLKILYTNYINELKSEADVLKTGLNSLDRVILGFENGSLYTIAGRPSMGKTSLAMSITANILEESKKAVTYFSYEMTEKQFMTRLLSPVIEIDSEKLRKRDLKDYEYQQLIHKCAIIEDWSLNILPVFDFDIEQLVSEIKKYKNANQADLVIIDDVHRIKIDPINRKYASNREQELSNNVRRLKDLAKELNIPIIIISQLNRQLELRGGDRRPQLIDLRDSGAIENDSDVVLFLYRAEHYGIIEDENGMSTRNQAEVIIAKNRMGRLETASLMFIDSFCKFKDLDSTRNENDDIYRMVTLPQNKISSSNSNEDIGDEAPF